MNFGGVNIKQKCVEYNCIRINMPRQTLKILTGHLSAFHAALVWDVALHA
jgi:hypothetical protein